MAESKNPLTSNNQIIRVLVKLFFTIIFHSTNPEIAIVSFVFIFYKDIAVTEIY